MTYEEALNKLLQVAGDYKAAYNARAVSEALAQKELEQMHKEVKKLVEEISPSSQFLSITLDPSGYPIVSALQTCTTFYSWIYGVQGSNNVEETVKDFLEKTLLKFLRECANTYSNTLDDLIRVNSYISLAYRNLTPEVIGKLATAIQRWHDRKVESDTDMSNFGKYCVNVRAAMNDMAVCWLREVEIVPGMKLIIKNLKTGTCEDRTVKKVGYSNGVRVLSFEESSSIVRGDERIVSVGSWFANNPEYSDLAKIYY